MAAENEQEIEVKFLVRDLAGLEARLQGLGASLSAERVFEANLRFDTPGRDLTRERRVLRLRRDSRARLTYKGPSQPGMEVSSRQEIEFEVSDYGAARRLLKALGYEVSAMYEKYRASYHLENLEVVLDELPYGNFAEIEGPGAGAIRAAAERPMRVRAVESLEPAAQVALQLVGGVLGDQAADAIPQLAGKLKAALAIWTAPQLERS